MKSRTTIACAALMLIVTAATAQASERNRPWCRQIANTNDPMLWSEGFGVAKCNDRAATPYRPWNSAAPVNRNQNDPMVARDDWRIDGFSAYDHRYDDRYDRRSHRYR